MMVELVDVHGVVEMTSGFVDGQGHDVFSQMVNVDVGLKTSLEISHLV